jgi:PhnB protein
MQKNCAAAIDFYKRAFGANERMRMPGAEGKIGHAELQIGDSVIMMADEAPQIEAFSVEHFGGSPISLLVYAPDCDAAYAQALSAGATGIREPADQPYGERMAGVRDPFGYKWWIGGPLKNAPQK